MRRAIDTQAFLARLPLFEGLTRVELARLSAGATRRALRRGDVLFRQGEPSTGLHAVVYGSIRLSIRGRGTSEQVIDVIGPGRSFGEPVMFLGKPYIVTATALVDSLVLHVARETIFAELERSPELVRRMIAALSSRAEALVRALETNAAGPAARRFTAWLLSRQPADADGEASVALPASKAALASQLNLSPEHFSRVLRDLESRALIESRGRRLLIPDLERLRAWHANPAQGDGA